MINCVKLSLTELFPLTAGAPAITLTPPEQSDTYKLHTQLKFQFQVTTLSATLYSGESTLVRIDRVCMWERERKREREMPEERDARRERERWTERRNRDRESDKKHERKLNTQKDSYSLIFHFYWNFIINLYNMFRHWMDRMLVLRTLLLVNSWSRSLGSKVRWRVMVPWRPVSSWRTRRWTTRDSRSKAGAWPGKGPIRGLHIG